MCDLTHSVVYFGDEL